MIVLDASAVVEWLLQRRGAEQVAERMEDPDVTVHAPSHLGIEVSAAMRGLERGGHITADRAAAAFADLDALGLHMHDPSALLPRAWQLRANLTPYDAVYVALAEVLDAPLVTCDARIARAPRLRATVDVIATQ